MFAEKSQKVYYIYFWRPHEENGYLGNWYPSTFHAEDICFKNSEQYFMWRKLKLFDPDNSSLERSLLTTDDPKDMKDIGQRVENFIQHIWDAEKYGIMRAAVYAKFSANTDLLEQLLSTGDSVLVEASPFDRIWGIGLTAKDAKRVGKSGWRGENLLGKALMDVRKELSSTVVSMDIATEAGKSQVGVSPDLTDTEGPGREEVPLNTLSPWSEYADDSSPLVMSSRGSSTEKGTTIYIDTTTMEGGDDVADSLCIVASTVKKGNRRGEKIQHL